MMSSITTYIIAPAANARAYGSIGCANVIAIHPTVPKIGSTSPLNCPNLKFKVTYKKYNHINYQI